MPLTLLRPQYLIIKNKLLRSTKTGYGRKRELLLFLIAAVIMLCIFGAITLLFRTIANEPAFISFIPKKMIDMLFAYFLILLILSNTVAAMGNIYSSEMLQLILQAPISNFRLYTAKFLETFLETGIMFFVLTAPAAIAYAISLHLPWQFLPAAFCASILFLLIPVGFGIALSTLFARFIAYFWRRGGLLLIGIMIAFFGSALQLSGHLKRVESQHGGARAISRMMGIYSDGSPLYLPSSWVADILGAFLSGESEGMTERWLLLASAALLSFSVGFFVFDWLFLRVRSSAHALLITADSKEGSDIARRIFDRVGELLPVDPQSRAIIIKDLSGLLRDRAQALQLLMYLGLGALYITVHSFMSSAINLTSLARELWVAFLASSNVLLVGLMTTTLLTRLVYPSVSLEGRAFWILQVTPVTVRHVIRAKLICWIPFTAFLCTTLMVLGGYALHLSPPLLAIIFLIGFCISTAITSLSVGLGSKYANFDWDSPSQLSVGLGTLALLLLSIVTVFLFAIPASILLLLLIAPLITTKIGLFLSLALQTFCLWTILFGAIYLAIRSVRNGAAALESRLKEV